MGGTYPMAKIMLVFGTRPEGIKMAPVYHTLRQDQRFNVLLTVTGQHRQLLDQVLQTFAMVPDYDLNIMLDRQSLTDVATRSLQRLEPVLQKEKPDLVLVHGDT